MRDPGRRGRIALGGALAGLAIGIPVLAQNAPQSLLPPGFDQPAQPQPAPSQQGASADQPVQEGPPPAPGDDTDTPSLALNAPGNEADTTGNVVADAEAEAKARALELPAWARRSTASVGPLSPRESGFGADAFGGPNGANGLYLAGLMKRLDAPIASRWASILLRRALLTEVPTPREIAAADWVAERVWLLLRMGEADAARMLVQSVDIENYTPRLYAMAMQTALATADPAALCPIADHGAELSDDTQWTLARGICATLSGDSGTGSALIDQVHPRNIDVLLAERIAGAASNSRRAVNIEWSGIYDLTSWRFGMASAAGLAIPDELYDDGNPRMRLWQARAPMLPLADRLPAVRLAASYGVLSSAALVDAYGQIFDGGDPNATDTPSAWLRAAYSGRDVDARLGGLRKLWEASQDARERYADLILTARAAARVVPSDTHGDQVPRLIDSMLSAGLDIQAARWARTVAGMSGTRGDEAWALLAVGTPRPVMALTTKRIAGFGARADSDQRRRAQLLFAGLAGLGRLAGPEEEALAAELGVPIGAQNKWTRAIDAAAEHGQDGTVAVLAAIGLQSVAWQGVPAFQLFHIVQGLRLTGHEAEARMIAVEAISRT